MAENFHSFEEVAKHNKKGDYWLILSGKVYDVTPFLAEHPGGDDVLLTSSGMGIKMKVWVKVYFGVDPVHYLNFNDAREKMKEFCIGNIDESTLPQKQQYSSLPTFSACVNRDSGDSAKILLYVMPLLRLGVAFLLRFYSKME